MPSTLPTIDDCRTAAGVIRRQLSPAPLIRSYALERQLGFEEGRRVWLKDYGWTPVGSFGVEVRTYDQAADTRTGERDRLTRQLAEAVGKPNWPILRRLLPGSVTAADDRTRQAMRWLYDTHGLRTEPSGAIAAAAVLQGEIDLDGDGDVVLSGRNVDEERFREWIVTAASDGPSR